MKIIIIGCNGFIGNHSFQYFSAQNEYSVFGCDIFDNYDKNNFKLISAQDDSYNDIFSENEFDICLNASGMANVSLSESNPMSDYLANVFNTIKILEAIRKFNPHCKLINLSSAAVYGNPESLPVKEFGVTNPISTYGFHKLQAELLCKEYTILHAIKTISLRLFSVYGERLKKQLFWDLANKIKEEGDTLSMFGKKDDSRDYIYITDLMQVLQLVVEKADFDGSAMNVASGVETKIEEVVQEYVIISKCNKKIQFSNEYLPGYPSKWKADVSLLKAIGFEPKISMKQGLMNYYQWVKELK